MKLDSIVYDYNSLQSAIATALNNESPTFQAIYPSDTATSLVNVLASYGSMLQYQLVSAMANMYTDSAYSEAGIYQLAETLGNRLHGNISSELYCNMTRTNLKGVTVTIPAGTKFTVEDLNFFNPETLVFPLSSNNLYKVKLVQGIKLVSEQTASGISGEKIYFCEDFKCNTNMVDVYVNGELWDITDSFLPYVVTDTSISNRSQAVILKTDSDGRTYIKFGNNTNGRIPEKGANIRIEYVSNEGANGNLNNNNLEIRLNTPIYYTNTANTRERLEVEITAITTASGGFNTQSIEVLKESSPYVFGSGQRAVRRDDYKAMLLNRCGYLTTNVWGEYEEAAIQGGYDKIMMNMVYYSGVKSIQKYDLQPVRSLNIDIANIAATLYGITLDSGRYAGWYIKALPDDITLPLTGLEHITKSYEEAILFKTKEEADAYYEEKELYTQPVYEYDETTYSNASVIWLDDPTNPKRDKALTYPISGNIEGARGFLGSYVLDISSFDIDNNTITVKYRDKQGTGILTCDPSINSTLSEFETKVFPTNDLINDTNSSTVSGYNFTITSNQDPIGGVVDANLTEVFVAADRDYKTSGMKNGQPFVITFDNPYQIRISFDEAKEVGAFAFKVPGIENYKYFPHQLAIYGSKEEEPDYVNIKNSNSWVKLSGMQTFDEELESGKCSDWITTNIYKPGTTEILEDDVTGTRQLDDEDPTRYVYYTRYTSNEYTYIIKVNGKTYTSSHYLLNTETGKLLFIKGDENFPIPSETDTVIVTATTYNWKKYKHYVIEVYSIHDSSVRSPQSIAIRQLKALYKDSVSTIDYSNNNATTINVPLRFKSNDLLPPTLTRWICLPDKMEFYEYKVTLANITEANGYRNGDILKWTNKIDDITYTFITNIISVEPLQYTTSLQKDTTLVSSNLRGKSNLLIASDPLDSSISTTRGTGGTISITSTSTVNVYGSYTGNFYTDADIQSADLPILNKYNHFTTYIEFKQPLIKNVVIEANVEYENVTTYQVVKNNVIAAINKLFELHPYSIGSSLNVSDIWKAINSVEGVKRFNVITPQNNINTLPYELLMLPAENLIINDIINSEYK